MLSDADARPPRELTPAFYGCYDWHSAVHGHWLLARLSRLFPEAEFAGEARAALSELARSGESAAEFARSRGFSTQRIHYWKKRLGATSAVPGFVPVRLPVVAPSTMAPGMIEIVSSGVTVRVREDLDVEHVARIVEALAGRARGC